MIAVRGLDKCSSLQVVGNENTSLFLRLSPFNNELQSWRLNKSNMKWKPFTHQDVTYQLDHLHPFELIVVQEAKGSKLERTYLIDVVFSIHCFTRAVTEGRNDKETTFYSDSRETREISICRYELSKRLPEIIGSLDRRKCYHTHHGNYFTIDLVGDDGEVENYEIYFTVSKSSKKGRLNLFVQSAYVRSKDPAHARKRKKQIGFKIIAYNTLMARPIKPSQ